MLIQGNRGIGKVRTYVCELEQGSECVETEKVVEEVREARKLIWKGPV